METRYVIEVVNHLNHTTKNAYIDNMVGNLGTQTMGQAALRIQGTIPVSVNEREKDYIVDLFNQGLYRTRSCGAKSLPEIVCTFGAMILPSRVVDFEVKIFQVDCKESFSNIEVKLIDSFKIEGSEGKGKEHRNETIYYKTSTFKSMITEAA